MRRNLLLQLQRGWGKRVSAIVNHLGRSSSDDHRSSCTDLSSNDVARAIFPNRYIASSGHDSAATC